MSWGAMGAFFLALLILFAVGNLWFPVVEFLMERIKRRLARREEPPAWHPLPTQEEQQQDRPL